MSTKATAVTPGLQSPSRSIKQGRQLKPVKQSLVSEQNYIYLTFVSVFAFYLLKSIHVF